MTDDAAKALGEYPEVRRVIVNLCVACIRGEGQECHTPGCALWMHRVDIPIGEELLEDADQALADARREGETRLEPYLQHREGCCAPLIKAVGANVPDPCNCGLDAALADTPEGEK